MQECAGQTACALGARLGRNAVVRDLLRIALHCLCLTEGAQAAACRQYDAALSAASTQWINISWQAIATSVRVSLLLPLANMPGMPAGIYFECPHLGGRR